MCTFLGVSLLSSGSFTMKPPNPPPAPRLPHNGRGRSAIPWGIVNVNLRTQSLQAFWSKGSWKVCLWNPESWALESGF